jgi:V8-like Glu-specific endopeptidase
MHTAFESAAVVHPVLGRGRSLPISALQREASDEAFEIIHTPDQRTRITDTTALPFRWVCSLKVYFRDPDDAKRVLEFDQGSGLLVGPSHVLTAAHVIYAAVGRPGRPNPKQEALRIDVFPGRTGDTTFPFGKARSESFAYPAAFTANMDRRSDYAMIKLKEDIGLRKFRSLSHQPVGYWGSDDKHKIVAVDRALLRGKIVNVAGYPDGKSHQLYTAYDTVNQVSPTMSGKDVPELLSHTVDTSNGQSGAPVWRHDPATGVRYLVAVHLGGCRLDTVSLDGCLVNGKQTSNMGRLLTQKAVDQITLWKDTMEKPPKRSR